MKTRLQAKGQLREDELRPRLISITQAYQYIGIGRAKFFADILPKLKTVRIGSRRLIDLTTLDEFIDKLLSD